MFMLMHKPVEIHYVGAGACMQNRGYFYWTTMLLVLSNNESAFR